MVFDFYDLQLSRPASAVLKRSKVVEFCQKQSPKGAKYVRFQDAILCFQRHRGLYLHLRYGFSLDLGLSRGSSPVRAEIGRQCPDTEPGARRDLEAFCKTRRIFITEQLYQIRSESVKRKARRTRSPHGFMAGIWELEAGAE